MKTCSIFEKFPIPDWNENQINKFRLLLQRETDLEYSNKRAVETLNNLYYLLRTLMSNIIDS